MYKSRRSPRAVQSDELKGVVLALNAEGPYGDLVNKHAVEEERRLRGFLKESYLAGPPLVPRGISQYALLLQMRASQRAAMRCPPPKPGLLHNMPLIRRIGRSAQKLCATHIVSLSIYERAARLFFNRLVKYVDSYVAAGSDFSRWSKRDAQLFQSFGNDLAAMQARLTNAGTLDLECSKPDRPIASARQDAARLFAILVQAAPATIVKCAHCGRYFLNSTGRPNRKYCMRKCALFVTAVQATKRLRQKERQEKLRRAQNAIASWKGTGNWKPWVAVHTGLSLTFLTRAQHRGELRPP